MSKATYQPNAHFLGADIPGQAAFISTMENKIGNLLGSRLTGQFKMLVAPDGFHYGFTYGNNGYYNANSLSDIDRTLIVDATTSQLGFGQQPFSVLYEKILKDTGYHLSSSDQQKMNQADIEAQAYTNALISAFKNDFPSVPLPPDTSAIATIFQYITTTFGSIDQVPVYYTGTKNALTDYSAHAAESYQMHSAISNAQSRLSCLIGNIDKPSAANGGMQTAASSFYAGYSLPDFAQTYASLTTDTNKIDISLQFNNFSSQASQLSIDHEAAFVIPLPVCIFGKSDTKYALNSLVTSESSVDMKMTFSGITTLAPSPTPANATAATGWYDESILSEIVRNTGNDSTGYCLINDEFNVKNLFGTNATFSRLKELVICQAPTITMNLQKVDTSSISEFFQHDSSLDIDFFGFGVSSSTHHYVVQHCTVDSQAQTATVILGAPRPSATVSVETEVAYVLGGVPSYPPASLTARTEKRLAFSFALPEALAFSNAPYSCLRGNIKLFPGSHTVSHYLGEVTSPTDGNETADAFLKIWYHYIPSENTVWLSDADDFTSDQTHLLLCRKDGQRQKKLNSHSCMQTSLTDCLDAFMEELIASAEDQGLTVVRRRDIPDNMKMLCYRQRSGVYKPLGSTYFGIRNIYTGNIFANASNTSGDTFFDPAGNPVNKPWKDLWSFVTMQPVTACVNCQSNTNLCGAHVLMGVNTSLTPTPGSQVDILPLCSRCNNFHNTGTMTAAFNTMSLVMLW